MCVQHNVVARSRNQCCGGNTVVRSFRIVEPLVTVNYIGILNVAQQRFYGKFTASAGTQKRIRSSCKISDFKQIWNFSTDFS
jgi:hypothetical protein